MQSVRNVLKVSELNNRVEERAYQEGLSGKYEVWRGGEVESVEKGWKSSEIYYWSVPMIYVACDV